jgi:Holliday junction resolvase RusA-like endonuclease
VTTHSITFDVIGTPVPQGSMKALGRSNAGRTIMTHSNGSELMPWRQTVAAVAHDKRPEDWPMDAPISMSITFRFPRPASHYKKDGTLKASAPAQKLTKPDLDKLVRSIGDALATILYRGDQQIISIVSTKRYVVGNESPGALITVTASAD